MVDGERRRFLRLLGIGGAGALLPGVTLGGLDRLRGGRSARSMAAAQAVSVPGDAVDLVADTDYAQGEVVNDALERVAAPDRTVYLPPGTYPVDGAIELGVDGLTVLGEDATLRPSRGTGVVLRVDGAGWTVSGIEFDYRDSGQPPDIKLDGRDWVFERVIFRGTRYTGDGGGQLLSPQAADGSTGVMRDVYMHEGNAPPDAASDMRLVWAGKGLGSGTLRFERCWFAGGAENTLYVSNYPGDVVVERCFFRNSNVGVPRVGGGATIRGTTIVKDGPHPIQAWSGGRGMRIWYNANKENGPGTVRIEDCDICYTYGDGPAPVSARQMDGDDRLEVVDTRFHVTTDREPVATGGGTVALRNVTVSGDPPASVLNGNVERRDITRVERQAADCTPPIPAPDTIPVGTTPRGGAGADSGDGADEGGGASRVHRLRLVGGTDEDPVNYQLRAGGPISSAEDRGSTDPTDGIVGNAVVGTLTGGEDLYDITGPVTRFQADGALTVTYDGTEMDVQAFRDRFVGRCGDR